MLKIKDSVDLKELEKFGFETRTSSEVNGIVGHGWLVENTTRKIFRWETYGDLVVLFDLIQAGLVEKV